ncbi:pyridoxal-dependent decarboxylase [Streptomyces sp. ID05-18]|uniref:pyridoxal-dependent decarboxylase n=1 Tax=Streptomyces sp. ID05-18 TaxID=3028662 RepID=UPI0029B23226|nr:pyridoxal-dependent decarboxylase [Streptomyces sp. ID05-18]MDX3484981.1 pyridoxal-dependent decarboxylase [Streptomyces sp. ID05-18]
MSVTLGDDSFRSAIGEVAAILEDYWEDLREERLPVTPDLRPGDVRAMLPDCVPVHGEPIRDVLADVRRVVMPGLVHWQHPSFLGYYPTQTSPASVVGELLASGLAVQHMMWSTGPAATELEEAVLDHLAVTLGLPERFLSGGNGGGVLQDSASSAVLVAVVAALYRASGGRWREHGAEGRYRLYCTDQANSCVPKASRIAGLGEPVLIATTAGTCEMDPRALREQLAADRAAGVVPAIVVASVGTTGTCAIDPVAAVAVVCREFGAWLHVDAAYAGSAAVCPENRWINEGVEHADSYAVNCHKWLLTGPPCDAMWVADRHSLTAAMDIRPAFLRNQASDSGDVTDFRDWQVPLMHPFRALKLWFVLRTHGVEGLRAHIREQLSHAALFAGLVRETPGFELVSHSLGLVCFRLAGDNARTERLRADLDATHQILVTPTTVDGRYILRAALGSRLASQTSVRNAWALVREVAASIPDDRPASSETSPTTSVGTR